MDIETLKLLYDINDIDMYVKETENGRKFLVLKRIKKFERPSIDCSLAKLERKKGYGMIVGLYPNSIQLRQISCEVYKRMPGFKKSKKKKIGPEGQFQGWDRNEEQMKKNVEQWKVTPWSRKYKIESKGIIKKTKKGDLKLLTRNEHAKNPVNHRKNTFYNFTSKTTPELEQIKSMVTSFVTRHIEDLYRPEFDPKNVKKSQEIDFDDLIFDRNYIDHARRQKQQKINLLADYMYNFIVRHYENL